MGILAPRVNHGRYPHGVLTNHNVTMDIGDWNLDLSQDTRVSGIGSPPISHELRGAGEEVIQ
jgi:hypothetical protein